MNTAATSAPLPDRQRAAPAVHSLDCFAFTVPDLEEAARFYGEFGLEVRRSGPQLELYTLGHPHRWGLVREAPGRPKKLQFLSFGCYERDFPELCRYLEGAGFEPAGPHPLAEAGGYWLRHPDGYPLQVLPADKCSPSSKSIPLSAQPVPQGLGAAPNRSGVARVRPRRLSHVLLFSQDVPRAKAFYHHALGLNVSDQSGDTIVFMHGIHGSDHHLIALAKSAGPGLHHLSWDVGSVDQVGIGMEHMLRAGYTGGWGVGRHVLGSNYFYYVRDPWGSYCEYSFDIDFVPKGFRWSSKDHPLEDSFYVWGPEVPADFVTNHEVAG